MGDFPVFHSEEEFRIWVAASLVRVEDGVGNVSKDVRRINGTVSVNTDKIAKLQRDLVEHPYQCEMWGKLETLRGIVEGLVNVNAEARGERKSTERWWSNLSLPIRLVVGGAILLLMMHGPEIYKWLKVIL